MKTYMRENFGAAFWKEVFFLAGACLVVQGIVSLARYIF
jgi:hypothetical protein